MKIISLYSFLLEKELFACAVLHSHQSFRNKKMINRPQFLDLLSYHVSIANWELHCGHAFGFDCFIFLSSFIFLWHLFTSPFFLKICMHFYLFVSSLWFYICSSSSICCAGNLCMNITCFPYNELRLATDNFHPSNKLGRGGFGTVYKVLEFTYDFTFNCESETYLHGNS